MGQHLSSEITLLRFWASLGSDVRWAVWHVSKWMFSHCSSI